MTKFIPMTWMEVMALDVELCTLCCNIGKPTECGQAKCMPHQRDDGKRGYFVEEVKP